MKKKVLFIIWSFSHGGGAEKILSDLVNNMDSSKYEIDILEYLYVGIKKEKIEKHVNLLPPIIDATTNNIFKKVKNKVINFLITRYPKVIRKMYLNKTYDVEISFNYMIPSLLLNEKSSKKIAWVHGDIYDLQSNSRNKKIQEKSFNKVDKIVAISNKTYESIIDVYPLYKNKTTIINNGYDFKKIKELSEEKEKSTVDILFCGRLDKNKNPLRLLEIFNKVCKQKKDCTLGYIGTGELIDNLKCQIKKYKLEKNVRIFGYQKNPYKFMNNSKLICMTSTSEGFPTVIIEAMTLGKPFISTIVAGTQEMSNNGNCGFTINDIDDYANKIIELLNNNDLYEKMSNNCKKYVKKFSIQNQVDKLENLINKE